MDINEVKEKKYELEMRILTLIKEFEKETNVYVGSITLNRNVVMGEHYPRLDNVTLEVKV